MNTEQLEKLKKLKDKGVISEEEFNSERRKILDSVIDESPQNNPKKGFFGIIILVVIIVIGGVFFIVAGDFSKYLPLNFACDKSTMRFAENLINKNYKNFNNSFRLSEPLQVKQSKNYLKCKAKTNYYREFPEIYYELDQQADGTILVQVNPYGDKFQQELDKATEELERALMYYSY